MTRLALAAAALAVSAVGAPAATIQLGFVLDGSGSITATEWTTITSGLAGAINLIPIGGANDYEVSVVQFSTNAVTYASASRILIDSVGARSGLSTFLSGIAQLGGGTNYQAGFNAIGSVLGPTIGGAAFSNVNFTTDGVPNVCVVGGNPLQCAGTGRDALIATGVDNLSIEGIGVDAGNAAFLQSSICYPQPCDSTSPYNFPSHGFYIGVANAAGYAAAIGNKIQIVTGQIPEPASLALVGLALAGLGVSSTRRRTATAAA